MDAQRMEALAGMVDEADAVGGPTPEQQQEQAQQAQQAQQQGEDERKAREWGVLAYTIGGALSMAAPELRQVYTEAACLDWGRSVVPVATKYGWDNGPSKVPEIGLLLSTLGLAIPTVYVLRQRIKEAKPEDAGKPGAGMLASLKAWWRDKRAAKAAQVVQRQTAAAQTAMEVVEAGADHGSRQ